MLLINPDSFLMVGSKNKLPNLKNEGGWAWYFQSLTSLMRSRNLFRFWERADANPHYDELGIEFHSKNRASRATDAEWAHDAAELEKAAGGTTQEIMKAVTLDTARNSILSLGSNAGLFHVLSALVGRFGQNTTAQRLANLLQLVQTSPNPNEKTEDFLARLRGWASTFVRTPPNMQEIIAISVVGNLPPALSSSAADLLSKYDSGMTESDLNDFQSSLIRVGALTHTTETAAANVVPTQPPAEPVSISKNLLDSWGFSHFQS